MGVASCVLDKTVELCNESPLVASCRNDNIISQKLLSKYMTIYGTSPSGMYNRFVDNNLYFRIYGNIIVDNAETKKL